MTIASIWAKKHNHELLVDTNNWLPRYNRGWADYFSSSVIEVSPELVADVKSRRNRRDTSDIILSRDLHESMTNGLNFKEFQEEFKRLFQVPYDLDSFFTQKGFLGVHIRRGDKIKTREMKNIPLSTYAWVINNELQEYNKKVLIITDDYSVVPEMQRMLPNSEVFSTSSPKTKGFNEASYREMSESDIVTLTTDAIKDLLTIKRSDFFLGTATSNLSRCAMCLVDRHKSLDRPKLGEAWFER